MNRLEMLKPVSPALGREPRPTAPSSRISPPAYVGSRVSIASSTKEPELQNWSEEQDDPLAPKMPCGLDLTPQRGKKLQKIRTPVAAPGKGDIAVG